MGLQLELPNEAGWYWAKDHDGDWYMAYVDTATETVVFFEANDPTPIFYVWDFDSKHLKCYVAWHGPFQCPGGDFGDDTVQFAEETHEKAEQQKKVMVLQHFDYRYCRDEGHGSSLSIVGVYDRDKAQAMIRSEVDRKDLT